MNKNNTLKTWLIILTFFFTYTSHAQAQWALSGNTGTTVGTNYLGTQDDQAFQINTYANARIRVNKGTGSDAGFVGIATTSPSSVLHIDGNGTPTTTGETFRTNGPSGSTQYWRMYNNGTEIFRIENPSGSSSSANLKVMPNAPMRLYTNDVERLHIDAGTTNTTGNIGIGNNFTAPVSRLHIRNNNSTDAWFQITGDNIGDASTDGLRIGEINSATGSLQSAEIRQLESADMNFQTSATQRMTIKADGKVGMGTASPGYQLDVLADPAITNFLAFRATVATSNSCSPCVNAAGTFIANNGYANYAIQCSTATGVNVTPSHTVGGSFYADAGTVDNYGVHAEAVNGGGSSGNIGGWFRAQGGTTNYGVQGDANSSANINHGGHFSATNGSGQNYGVYASGGSSCTSSTCTDVAGFFSGDIIYHAAFVTSDAFLKDNVTPVINASSLLGQMMPKTYTFKTQNYPSMHLDQGNQYGLIAEDIEQIIPELVHHFSEPEVKDDQGNTVYAQVDFKAINYNQMIPILIAGFKEQQAQIDALTIQLNGCCPGNHSTGSAPANTDRIDLENVNTLQLLEADPNPFSESTMIKWNIPDEFQNAVIYFYDNNGNKINTYKISSKGSEELQLFGSKLSSGIYSYTLVVDGKLIDTKKLVKSK